MTDETEPTGDHETVDGELAPKGGDVKDSLAEAAFDGVRVDSEAVVSTSEVADGDESEANAENGGGEELDPELEQMLVTKLAGHAALIRNLEKMDTPAGRAALEKARKAQDQFKQEITAEFEEKKERREILAKITEKIVGSVTEGLLKFLDSDQKDKVILTLNQGSGSEAGWLRYVPPFGGLEGGVELLREEEFWEIRYQVYQVFGVTPPAQEAMEYKERSDGVEATASKPAAIPQIKVSETSVKNRRPHSGSDDEAQAEAPLARFRLSLERYTE